MPSQQSTPVTAASVPLDPVQLVATLREIRAQIPEYQQLTIAEARALRTVANVDAQVIEGVIVASSDSSLIQDAIGMTPDTMREEGRNNVLWSAVEEELKALTQGVGTTNVIRRHRLGLAALQAYNIARQLVRRKEHANLLPHVANLKRLIKVGQRARATTTATDKATPPATDPKTTPPATTPDHK
jgi:hypothetical protein